VGARVSGSTSRNSSSTPIVDSGDPTVGTTSLIRNSIRPSNCSSVPGCLPNWHRCRLATAKRSGCMGLPALPPGSHPRHAGRLARLLPARRHDYSSSPWWHPG
jgi:hypothetical protein